MRHEGYFLKLEDIQIMSNFPDSYKVRSGPGVSGVSKEQMTVGRRQKVRRWDGNGARLKAQGKENEGGKVRKELIADSS
jgi:hypothetical protein